MMTCRVAAQLKKSENLKIVGNHLQDNLLKILNGVLRTQLIIFAFDLFYFRLFSQNSIFITLGPLLNLHVVKMNLD